MHSLNIQTCLTERHITEKMKQNPIFPENLYFTRKDTTFLEDVSLHLQRWFDYSLSNYALNHRTIVKNNFKTY